MKQARIHGPEWTKLSYVSMQMDMHSVGTPSFVLSYTMWSNVYNWRATTTGIVSIYSGSESFLTSFKISQHEQTNPMSAHKVWLIRSWLTRSGTRIQSDARSAQHTKRHKERHAQSDTHGPTQTATRRASHRAATREHFVQDLLHSWRFET